MAENNNNEDQAKLEAERKRLYEEMMASVQRMNGLSEPDGKAAKKRQEDADERAKKIKEDDDKFFKYLKISCFFSALIALPFFIAGKIVLSVSILIIGVIIAVVIATNNHSIEQDKEAKNALQEANFEVYRSIKATGTAGSALIAVNPRGGTRLVRAGKVESYFHVAYAEIDIDGHSETKTDRMSQATGAVVGAALTGGVGAIIGGLSGSTKTTEKVNSISLRFAINDQPYEIYFFRGKTTKGSSVYNNAINEARYWKSILKKGRS